MSGDGRAYMMKADEGQAIWFAGALMILKAAGDRTEGRFALLDQRVAGDYAVPRHVHHAEDEAWYVLEGEVTFYCGDETFAARPSAWVFLPKDVPHAFRVGPAVRGGQARCVGGRPRHRARSRRARRLARAPRTRSSLRTRAPRASPAARRRAPADPAKGR